MKKESFTYQKAKKFMTQNNNHLGDELLDIVDQHDNVIGQKWRSEVDKHPELYIRSVVAFIENDQGQLWIPRRVASKKRYPLALDMSVAGCVGAGESYEQAFAREVQEEVNIDIKQVPCELMGYLKPPHDGIKYCMKIYKIKLNQAPNYNPDDYCEYYWLTPQQAMDRVKNGDYHKPGLPILLRLLYGVKG